MWLTFLTFFKNRAVAYGVAALLAVLALIYWHKHSVNVAVYAERERITAAHEQAHFVSSNFHRSPPLMALSMASRGVLPCAISSIPAIQYSLLIIVLFAHTSNP